MSTGGIRIYEDVSKSMIWVIRSLTNFDVIAEEAAKAGYIRPEDISRLIKFRNNPNDPSWRML